MSVVKPQDNAQQREQQWRYSWCARVTIASSRPITTKTVPATSHVAGFIKAGVLSTATSFSMIPGCNVGIVALKHGDRVPAFLESFVSLLDEFVFFGCYRKELAHCPRAARQGQTCRSRAASRNTSISTVNGTARASCFRRLLKSNEAFKSAFLNTVSAGQDYPPSRTSVNDQRSTTNGLSPLNRSFRLFSVPVAIIDDVFFLSSSTGNSPIGKTRTDASAGDSTGLSEMHRRHRSWAGTVSMLFGHSSPTQGDCRVRYRRQSQDRQQTEALTSSSSALSLVEPSWRAVPEVTVDHHADQHQD